MEKTQDKDTRPLKEKHPDRTQKSSQETKLTGNSMPAELLSKIYGYIDNKANKPLLLCNLALVCQRFYDFFTNPVLWAATGRSAGQFLLLQNTVKNNIWEHNSLNEWYNSLFDPGKIKFTTLPAEIWRHRKLLLLVLEQPSGWFNCAPSREDFKPYSNDPVLAIKLIQNMPESDCFTYISNELRGDENIALSAIKRFPTAIAHCSSSLLNDREFVKKAVRTNGDCLQYLGDYRQDSELVIYASRYSLRVLKFARGQARMDIDRIFSEKIKGKAPQDLFSTPGSYESCKLCGRTR